MEINILHLAQGAKQARGLVVIIDVFRAFSTACYVMHNGADKIIPVSKTEEAFRLKKLHPEYILIGEENERTIPGFEYGNSPSFLLNVDFRGKIIVQRTSAGTQGIVNANNASKLITGSFVNAEAVINYIWQQQPGILSLVCMGFSAREPVQEDIFCAEYIRNTIEGKKSNFRKMAEKIKKTSARRFYDPVNASFSPPEDVDLCLDLNRFGFILKAERTHNDKIFLRRIDIHYRR